VDDGVSDLRRSTEMIVGEADRGAQVDWLVGGRAAELTLSEDVDVGLRAELFQVIDAAKLEL